MYYEFIVFSDSLMRPAAAYVSESPGFFENASILCLVLVTRD